MSRRSQRQISLSQEDEEIINRYFPYGSFSKFVSEKLREYQIEREAILRNPTEIEKLKPLYNSAVRVINRNRGNPMMMTYAKRWEGIIREQGGLATVKELLALADKYRFQGDNVNVEV